MGVYITQETIQASMSDEDYNRLYDRKGSGNATEILNFTNQCISVAESLTNMTLNGKLPVPLPAPIDTGIQQCVISIANSEAASFHPAFKGPQSPYQAKRAEALDLLRRVARDYDMRPVTSPTGPVQPQAAVINPQNPVGDYNDPYTRIANGEDNSGY